MIPQIVPASMNLPAAFTPNSLGPGAPGSTVFTNNLSAALMAAGAAFQVSLDLPAASFMAATTFEIMPVPAANQLYRVLSVFAVLNRIATVAFSANRTYQLNYDIAAGAQNALSTTLGFSLTTTSAGATFTEQIFESGRDMDLGSSNITAVGQLAGARLILVPTVGGTITGGGNAQLRMVFTLQRMTLPTGTV